MNYKDNIEWLKSLKQQIGKTQHRDLWHFEQVIDETIENLKPLAKPHGRLIDADQLQTAIHGLLCENCVTFSCEKGIGCLIEDIFNLIDEAPAVIEAEHESEAQKWARVGRDISKGLQEGIEAINSEEIEE